jgi:hypothetical protein
LREQSPQAIFETGELELVDEHFLLFLFCQKPSRLETLLSPNHLSTVSRIVRRGVGAKAELHRLDRR